MSQQLNTARNVLSPEAFGTMVDLYVRVSTNEQAEEGYSIGEQEARLRSYCDAMRWTVRRVYIDPGYSGSSTDRPALQEMIRDVESGMVNKVVVYKLDRLSRSQFDTLYLIEKVFLTNNTDFVSMTENFDTGTPFGRAMIGILAVFAQLEREKIKERMSMGLDARAKEGYYHGGPYAPIGYDYQDGDLQINEYEAMQVRKLYELVFTGMPIYSVYKYMSGHGYTHKHGKWSVDAIRSCLTTVVYSGRIQWKGEIYEGRHDGIVSVETFDKMQHYLANRDIGKFPKHPFQRTTLLGGILFCGNCGARYYCKQNVSRKPGITPAQRYYTCYSRGKSAKNMIKDPNCKNKTWNVKDLDKVVLDEVRKLAADPDYISTIIHDSAPDTEESNTQVILDRIDSIDKQIGKLVDLYQIASIDFNTINAKIASLNEEKEALKNSLSEEKKGTMISVQEAKEILLTFSEVVDTAEPEVLRDLVHSLIDGVVINGEDIEIHWKFV